MGSFSLSKKRTFNKVIMRQMKYEFCKIYYNSIPRENTAISFIYFNFYKNLYSEDS